ncbi:MAG: alpha/beta fold hydrolase [Hyphomicrobiaceae bacterium]|nr:alpha/beta fold hydrolase [Hyphomicrobiaceae bacterium]
MNRQDRLQENEGSLLLPGGRVGVLLIHGLGGTPVELRFVAQALHRAGHTVYCPLLVGHGGSEDLLNTTTWTDWYNSVEEAHDLLKQRCDVVLAGGLSAGVPLALLLAARRPQHVHGTLLFSPTFWPNGWAIPWYFTFFRLVRQKWLANLIHLRECAPYGIKDDRIRRFVLDSLQSDGRPLEDIFGRSGGTVLEFSWLAKAARQVLGEVKQPALIFHPRFDDQSDISNTIMLQRRLGGLAEVVVLEDSYHMVTLDRQRTLVVEKSLSFTAWIAGQIEAGEQMERIKQNLAASE